MSYRSQIKVLLKELDFKKVIWEGAMMFVGSNKTIFWDVDFIDNFGEPWNVREFKSSDYKNKMQLVVELFRKMHVKKGTKIEI